MFEFYDGTNDECEIIGNSNIVKNDNNITSEMEKELLNLKNEIEEIYNCLDLMYDECVYKCASNINEYEILGGLCFSLDGKEKFIECVLNSSENYQKIKNRAKYLSCELEKCTGELC